MKTTEKRLPLNSMGLYVGVFRALHKGCDAEALAKVLPHFGGKLLKV